MPQVTCERVTQRGSESIELEISTSGYRCGRRNGTPSNELALRSQIPSRQHKPREPKHNKSFGRRGEDVACEYLRIMGYKIIDRNWTCSFGEVDIVMLDESSLVFVEVKTRRGTEKGFPSEAVGPKKREKYEKIALAYISNISLVNVTVRFDVVSIVVTEESRALIKHHVNAFGVG